MQTPQSLEELESAIACALTKAQGLVELSGWVSKQVVEEAAKELIAAIRESQESGVPLSPCQRLAGEAIIAHVQRALDVWWRAT